MQNGPACLSLRECLALLIGTGPAGLGALGVATTILSRPGSGLGVSDEEKAFFTAMESTGRDHLQGIPGLGMAGQARILAAFELGRRYAGFRSQNIRAIPRLLRHLPSIARTALQKIPDSARLEAQEWLGFVPIYRSGAIGDLCVAERGARTHVNTDPAELFARILALRPGGFFLFHNHPSGNLSPSAEDLDLTARVKSVAQQLGIRLLGHWVVAPHGEQWIDADNPWRAAPSYAKRSGNESRVPALSENS